MFADYVTLFYVNLIAAVIAGKWALELGFSQVRQLLWMIAAFVFPPLVLLALYVRLIRRQQAEHKLAGAWY
jgi:predicted membrane protein